MGNASPTRKDNPKKSTQNSAGETQPTMERELCTGIMITAESFPSRREPPSYQLIKFYKLSNFNHLLLLSLESSGSQTGFAVWWPKSLLPKIPLSLPTILQESSQSWNNIRQQTVKQTPEHH